MTEIQVKCFLRLSSCNSIRQAAKTLNMSQPALSKHIKLLEKDLDMELFTRSVHGMSLTGEGRIMLEAFNSASELIGSAVKQAAKIKGNSLQNCSETVTLAYVRGWKYNDIILNWVRRYLETHDNVQVVSRQLRSGELLKALEDGKIDIAFADKNAVNYSSSFIGKVIGEIKYYIICNRNHSIAKIDGIDYGELCGEILVAVDGEDEFLDNCNDLRNVLGYYPETVKKVGSVELQIVAVKCDMGISFISSFFRSMNIVLEDANIAVIDTGYSSEISAIINKHSANKSARQFFDLDITI